MDYVILHFVEIRGEGERIVIVAKADLDDEARTPPVGFKLYQECPAEIQNAPSLPLGRTLVRSDR